MEGKALVELKTMNFNSRFGSTPRITEAVVHFTVLVPCSTSICTSSLKYGATRIFYFDLDYLFVCLAKRC